LKKLSGRAIVFLGIGSNAGNRAQKISAAIREITARWPLLRASSLYLTSPIGPRQRDFLNAVVSVTASGLPGDMLCALKAIERKLGRRSAGVQRWGPRTIDIDILLWGKRILRTPALVIPHPEMLRRRFVLEPLAEIAPHRVHPVAKKSMTCLRDELRERRHNQKVKKYE